MLTVYQDLKELVPSQGCRCLADILNAAWKLYEEPDLWQDYFPNNRHRVDKTLKDLVLKNIEVFEIEQMRVNPTP